VVPRRDTWYIPPYVHPVYPTWYIHPMYTLGTPAAVPVTAVHGLSMQSCSGDGSLGSRRGNSLGESLPAS